MHTLLHFSLFLILACVTQDCLASDIIHGKKAKNGLLPYMASVQVNEHHICGGFLVSEDFVMTAAHCVEEGRMTVVLGTHNLKEVRDSMRYKVKKCKHPSYVNVSKGDDIMLLKLSKKPPTAKPIRIPVGPMSLKPGTKCRVAGWGAIRTGGPSVDDLYVVDVPIIKKQTCQKFWNNDIPKNVICAGGFGITKGFCQGDSGGPLVCSNKMAVGIVSYNKDYNCDYPDVPNIYTDVSKYIPWVQDILKGKTC